MWPQSSSVNVVNLVKKNCHNSRDIEFFLGDYFFGAPCSIAVLISCISKNVYHVLSVRFQ